MKTMTQAFNATSKNHGSEMVELKFSLNEVDTNAYIVVVECITAGFTVGGQTSGYTSAGRMGGVVVDGRLVLRGKKSLSRLGTQHIYLFKDGCGEGEKDRFFPYIHPTNFDPSPLTREAGVPKYSVFRSLDDGHVYISRNIEPRFIAKYVPDNEINNTSFINFQDSLSPDPAKLAKMMRGIGEAINRFLKNEKDAQSR